MSTEIEVNRLMKPYYRQRELCYSVGETLFFDHNRKITHYRMDFMHTTSSIFGGVYFSGGRIKPGYRGKNSVKKKMGKVKIYRRKEFLLLHNQCLPVFYHQPGIEDDGESVPAEADQRVFISETLVIGDEIVAKLLRIEASDDEDLGSLINQCEVSDNLVKQFYLVDLWDTLGFKRPPTPRYLMSSL